MLLTEQSDDNKNGTNLGSVALFNQEQHIIKVDGWFLAGKILFVEIVISLSSTPSFF